MIDSQILNNEVAADQKSEPACTIHFFEERLNKVLKNHLHRHQFPDVLNSDELQMMFDLTWSINPPVQALNSTISDFNLEEIKADYYQIIKEFKFKHEGSDISLPDYNILASFYHVVYHGIKSRKRARYIKETFAVPFLEGVSMLTQVPKMYAACFFMLINRLNDISKYFYSFEMISKQEESGMKITPVLSICFATKESMLICRSYRSVYKIANPLSSSEIKWLTIPEKKDQTQNHNNKACLNMYIQAHALTCLKESLDIFDKQTINAILNYNLRHVDKIESYKENLLLPIKIYNIKIGYLICIVSGSNLVARTFSFIHQKDTPEGDRLIKDITQPNLNSKLHQAYKLSLLLKLNDKEKQKLPYELREIFHLKNYNLNINTMQEANYDEFISYIKQGEDTELIINNTNREELALQSYSIGKLMQLLIINTLGLVVAQLVKMYYSIIHKFKSLLKKNETTNMTANYREENDCSKAKPLAPMGLSLVSKKTEQVS